MDRSVVALNTPTPARWRVWLGVGFACAGLLWVLHDVRPADIVRELAIRYWAFLLPAILADILSYAAQGLRWKLLMAPVGEFPLLSSTQAIYAGLFFNEIAPMRLGEIVRAFLASRRIGVRPGAVVPSMAVERLIDGIWLTAAIGIATVLVPVPVQISRAADILGGAVLAASAVFLVLVIFGGKGFASSWTGGFRSIGTSGSFWWAFAVSSLIPVLQALAFWLVMLAYPLPLPFSTALVVFLIVHLGTALPNAPANVGSFQFVTVLGLTLFGIDKTSATAFSIAVFIVLTAPLWIIGGLALLRTGMTMSEIRRSIRGRAI